MNLNKLPKAPRRFEIINEDTWIGKPSVPYGVVRRLAHERRKTNSEYIRVLYGEAGRRGDPWGGLELEINGVVYHFSAGVKRWPEFHDGRGNLTESGKQALATGVPGNLSQGVDWRWVQDEVDLTGKMSPTAISDIADDFRQMIKGEISLPIFQSQIWARRLGIPIHPEYHNCTTIILRELREKARLILNQRMPLQALEALQQLVGDTRSQLDAELNFLLTLPEERINDLLESLAARSQADWNGIAKGIVDVPEWLKWSNLLQASKD